MAVKDISIADFDYALPQERIALHPLPERDRCKLLVVRPPLDIEDRLFADLPSLLPPDSLLVCNDTRVINARLHFRKPTGALIEIFLLEPILPSDYQLAFAAEGAATWAALVGNVKKWKSGPLTLSATLPDGSPLSLQAELGSSLPGGERSVRLTWLPAAVPFAEVVEAAGFIPIPPYLNRESEMSDNDDYQTVYSRADGSVAAPTAGLHFTPRLLNSLQEKNIRRVPLTLHVGAGTFKPVKADRIGDHPMHTEVFSISRAALSEIIEAKKAGRKITAVGTTSVRTLETLPLLADIADRNPSLSPENLHLNQWEAYSPEALRPRSPLQTANRLSPLLSLMDRNGLDSLTASTAIMIAPGFNWTITDAMITNFHQPRSTLLLLVSSFLSAKANSNPLTDQTWRQIYRHALQADYRFLSYGDACLFL